MNMQETSAYYSYFLDPEKNIRLLFIVMPTNADWKNNPEAYAIEKFIVDNKTKLRFEN